MTEKAVYTTKPFMTGRSQAIRIPREYRIEETEVVINRIGDCLVITPKESLKTVFYEGLNSLTDDFLADGRPEEVPNDEVSL
ncbi:MAG: AbrB/MazE/SpoVT family DNA-binding domain-containing protein [Eubacteriaceae bacterium]|nr:AbrB/MazE/SpoVT family DNA-binding domain-containing protein [Eubacteriaceae bacterium]